MAPSRTDSSIYEELNVSTVVNAAGTKTRIGGSLIRTEAVEAMADAAGAFARISDLQAQASERIAAVTIETGAKVAAPEVVVRVDPETAGVSAVELVRTLRSEDPRAFVAADDAPEGRFAVNPMCLDDAQAEYVVERISAAVEN